MFISIKYIKSEFKNYTYAPLSQYTSDTNEETNQNVSINDNGSSMSSRNDYGSIMGNVKRIFCLDGIRKLFVNIIGKIYYLFTSSCFLVFYAMIEMIYIIYCGLFNIKNEEKKEDIFLISIYLVFSVFFAIAIASIFLLDYSRQDTITYGRYTEYVIGPLLVLGFYILLKRKVTFKLICIGCILEVMMSCIIKNVIMMEGLKEYYDNNAVGLVRNIMFLYGQLENKNFAVSILVLTFLQSISIFFLFKVKKNGSNILAVILCIIIWVRSGDAVFEHNTLRQQTNLLDTVELAQYLKVNAGEESIYYLNVWDGFTIIDYMQFQLVKYPIKVIEPDDLEDEIMKGYYLVPSNSEFFLEKENYCIKTSRNFRLYYYE